MATLTVQDANGLTVPSFTGTVTFSSSDSSATFPTTTFVAGDAGQKSVTFTLFTSGAQTVQATSGTISSATGNVTVVAATAASLVATTSDTMVTSGVSFDVIFSAYDQYNNLATAYTGTLAFSSNDNAATLPSNYTFTALDAGTASVPGFALATETTAGSITGTDTANSALTATVGDLTVAGGAATQFLITTANSTWTAGTPAQVTIKALDSFGGTATNYTGSVSWTAAHSSSLPANVSFNANDAGVVTTSAPTFCGLGAQHVSVQDTVNSGLKSNILSVTVNAGDVAMLVMNPNINESVTQNNPAYYNINTADICGNLVAAITNLTFSASDSSVTVPGSQSTNSSGFAQAQFNFTHVGDFNITVHGGTPDLATSINGIGVHTVTNLGGGGLAASNYTSYTCAVIDNASLKCFGEDISEGNSGNLGYGDTLSRGSSPATIGPNLPYVDFDGRAVSSVYGGWSHTCAILQDANVKCWGNNDTGQLGLGDSTNRGDSSASGHQMGANLPDVLLPSGRTALKMALGYQHTCALLDNGTVTCWGLNNAGELGVGDTTYRGSNLSDMGDNLGIIDFGGGHTVTDIMAEGYGTCAVLDDGSVKCWGHNDGGPLGLGDNTNRGDGSGPSVAASGPVDLGTGRTATSLGIGAGLYHACAILDDQNMKCWGYNANGQLGTDSTATYGTSLSQMGDNLPELPLGDAVTAIALSTNNSCALLANGSVKCWGQSNVGTLGQETSVEWGAGGNGPAPLLATMPAINLGTGRTATQIALNDFSACAVLDNGHVRCWGFNPGMGADLGIGTAAKVKVGADPNTMGDNMLPTNLW